MTEGNDQTTYALFWLYKATPEWRRLEGFERDHLREEFAQTLEDKAGALTLRFECLGGPRFSDLDLGLPHESIEIRPRITSTTTCTVDMGRAHLTSGAYPDGFWSGAGSA